MAVTSSVKGHPKQFTDPPRQPWAMFWFLILGLLIYLANALGGPDFWAAALQVKRIYS